jgi:hypothetical protein
MNWHDVSYPVRYRVSAISVRASSLQVTVGPPAVADRHAVGVHLQHRDDGESARQEQDCGFDRAKGSNPGVANWLPA